MTDEPTADPLGGDGPGGKPRFRGVSHKYGFYAALIAGVTLVHGVNDPTARLGAVVYAASVCSLLGVSALYHRIWWPERVRLWMRRLDHTMIFVMIAGCYTPMALLTMDEGTATMILAVEWGIVLLALVINLIWPIRPKWVTPTLSVGAGWVGIFGFPDILAATGWGCVGLLLLGGLVYTLGAVFYARKWPNPIPGIFGYHEVFHALVIVGAAMHYVAMTNWVFALRS